MAPTWTSAQVQAPQVLSPTIVHLAELLRAYQCTVEEFAISVWAEGAWPGIAHCCGEACSGLVKGFKSYCALQPSIRVVARAATVLIDI